MVCCLGYTEVIQVLVLNPRVDGMWDGMDGGEDERRAGVRRQEVVRWW